MNSKLNISHYPPPRYDLSPTGRPSVHGQGRNFDQSLGQARSKLEDPATRADLKNNPPAKMSEQTNDQPLESEQVSNDYLERQESPPPKLANSELPNALNEDYNFAASQNDTLGPGLAPINGPNLMPLTTNPPVNNSAYYQMINEELYFENLKAGVVFIQPRKQLIAPQMLTKAQLLGQPQFPSNGIMSADQPATELGAFKLVNEQQIRQNLQAATVFALPVIEEQPLTTGLANSNQAELELKPGLANQLKNPALGNNLSQSLIADGSFNSGDYSSQDQSLNWYETELTSLQQPTDTKLDTATRLSFARNLDMILPQVRTMVANGSTHLRIKLSPQELGGLELRLIKSAGKINASIITDSKELSDYLLTHTERLKASLSEQGIMLDNVEVKHQSDQQSDGSGLDFASSQQEQNQTANKRPATTVEPPAVEEPDITYAVGSSPGEVDLHV